MRDNLDDNEKEDLRKEDNERKKERRVTWTMMRKISEENMRKKERKLYVKTLIVKKKII